MGFFDRFRKKPESPSAPAGTAGAALPADWLVAATELAGFFAAHAVWCVSQGEILIPLGGFEDAKGQRTLQRFEADRIEHAVAEGEKWFAANRAGARRAVFIFDAFITLETGKTDALIVKVRDFAAVGPGMQWAIPYRSASAPGGFAVHRPKANFENQEGASRAVALGEALWRGIAAHEKGAAVWNEHLNESR